MPSRAASRLFPLALAAMFVLVVAGLFAADRAVTETTRVQAREDAVESAARIQGFVNRHVQALSAMHGLFTDSATPPSRERFDRLVSAVADHLSGFRRVWLADSAGRVLYEHAVDTTAPPLPAGIDVDTLRFLQGDAVVRRARQTRQPQISPADSLLMGGTGFIVVEPIYIDHRLAGFAGGVMTTDVIRERLRPSRPSRRAAALVRLGADTVTVVGRLEGAGPILTDVDSIRMPGNVYWHLQVMHGGSRRPLRIALWLIGLGIVVTLTVALLHEARLAHRIAERSAELEHLSAELLQANRAKSEFLANVSHELRTPLNAIVGFVELLRDGVYGELTPRQMGPVQRMESSANHLRHLVDQILDLAKITAGRLEVHTEIIDLRPFVLDVVAEVEALVSERGLSASVNIAAVLPRVRTDPTHLRQILLNLLSNAVKYTPEGGIAVRARLLGPPEKLAQAGVTGPRAVADGPGSDPPWLDAHAPRRSALWIALQVADTGIGIAPADHDRIFEEFEQVNAGPRGDSMRRGTGLGLPISRRLARLLGGEITLESELGKGATFTVWLPVREEDFRQPVAAPGQLPLASEAAG